MNFAGKIKRMYESLEEQVEDIADVADSDSGAMLACFGTPCPPYSTQRPKRFSDGAVKDHPSFNTTFVGAYNFLFKYEPMVAIMEQVEGFDLRFASGTDETPRDRLWLVGTDLGAVNH